MQAPSSLIPTKPQNSQRQWLKQSMLNIENNISTEASMLMLNATSQLPINLKKNKPVHEAKNEEEKQKSLIDLKKEESKIRQKLREICKMQKLAKPKSKYPTGNSQHQVKSDSQLRKLAKKYRRFKQQLIQKTRLIEEQEQIYKEKVKKLKQQEVKTQCEQRRKKIEQTLFRMQERRIKRKVQLKQQKIKLKELKKQKLYEKMKENFNKSMNEMNERQIQRYRRMKNSNSVDISSLSLHQKQYQEQKQQKQEKRTQRLAESRIFPEINQYKSKFFDMVMENERENQQKQLQKAERAKMVKKMHKQYQQRIQQFAPAPKQSLIKSDNKENKKSPLERSQIFKKGNEFYKEGLKKAIPASKREEYYKKKEMALQQMAQKPYPNYLPQISKRFLPYAQKMNKSYISELQKLKKRIQSDGKMSKDQKIQEIKICIQKMQHCYPPDKSSQDELVRRLNSKMELLELLR